jgi:flagellar biosynthesis chaperone FliJ
MPFVFRLQPILDQRSDLRKQAEEKLKATERELAAEKRTLQELEQAVNAAARLYRHRRVERSRSRMTHGVSILLQNASLIGLEMELQEARSAALAQQILVDQALELVDEANVVLASRRLEEEVLEKYRQKVKTRFEQEESYKEELEQDEIGSVIYMSKRART